MKIAIVGANSGVGTELALLAREEGHSVIPVVRSFRSAWFLEHCGFTCSVGTVTADDEAKSLLSGAEMVVIAAFAGQSGRSGLSPNRNSKINRKIVQNSVKYSPKNATVVYLSTIHAFGSSVGPSYFSWYGIEKRRAENELLKVGKKENKKTYAIRLGHVIGEIQGKKSKLIDKVSEKRYSLRVRPGKSSNVVNIVTILDALEKLSESVKSGKKYTLTNKPNWSWEKLYKIYNIDLKSISFEPKKNDNFHLISYVFQKSKQFYDNNSLVARSLFYLMPDWIPEGLQREYRHKKVKKEIDSMSHIKKLDFREFSYAAAPGPFIDALEDTEDTLKQKPKLAKYFQ